MNLQSEIKNATDKFENLLSAQIERAQNMDNTKKDKGTNKKTVIGLIGGDGIGPIIMKSAEAVLKTLLKGELENGQAELKKIDGLTIENRKKLGVSVPKDILNEIKKCDTILKGPTETLKGGTLESANVTLRRELDLYANVRPIKIEEKNIDWTFFRENTEGEYVLGSLGIEIPDLLAFDFKVTTVKGTKRIARAAFEYAKANGKTRLAIVTKANIMKKTDGMFSEICHKVAEDYRQITAEDYYVDIMTANLINKDINSNYQVFVLPNLYGDIITDEAAQIQGGVGTAGSANIGDNYAMFEAIHGTAPQLIKSGKGDYANPTSILKACEMMLNHIGFNAAADKLALALSKCKKTDNDGVSCKEYTEKLIKVLTEN